MSDRVVQRAREVVWRQAHDRVLLRRVGDHSDRAQADLHGLAALAWVAMDEPMTSEQFIAVLAGADLVFDPDEIAAALWLLIDEQWMTSSGEAS